jgi:hypothetical protein
MITTTRGTYFAFVFFMTLFFAADAFSQTRAAQWAALQAEKAKVLAPRQPTKAEKILMRAESNFTGTSQGFYPFFGSAFPGGGLAFGAGYRRLYGDTGIFDVHGGYSIAGYKLATTTLQLPTYASGRMKTLIHAKYQFADEVPFFGIGNETDEEDETAFEYTPISFGVGQSIALTREFHIGGDLSYQKFDTSTGNSSRVPSLEDFFPVSAAPGFGLDFEYITGNVFVEYDWRFSPGYTTTGGLYRVDWTTYAERDEPEGFDFTRLDIELVQHVPILRGNQILAFRGLASITDTKGDDVVPFFLLPKLGGGSELRGFRDFRFRDNNRLLVTGEYRWAPSKFMDMVLFYEVGKVARLREDLDFEDLHSSYGIGARFHGPNLTALRIELARSVEGMRLIVSGGAAF